MKRKIMTKFLILMLVISIFPAYFGLSNLSQFENIIEIGEIDSKNTKKHTSDHPIDIPFIYGTQYRLHYLDPQDAWDRGSFDVIQQVCEGLYGYNYSDPEMEIIPYLATAGGVWSPDGLNYTVPLRSGVIFHDGTPFNASAVK
ncbi:MAG: ABC transporter substrate-binding protein, partial [Candidatus Heimdallarchaeota archaeon]